MPDDYDTIHADIEALFRRIAELQLEPASAMHSGLTGTQRAEIVVGTIEHYITMARHRRNELDNDADDRKQADRQ